MSALQPSLLILTGDSTIADSLESLLSGREAYLARVTDVDTALAELDARPFDAVLLDFDHGGDAAARALVERHPGVWLIAMVSGGGDAGQSARRAAAANETVTAIEDGVCDVLGRLPERGDLWHAVDKAFARTARQVDEPPPAPSRPGGLFGESEPMQKVFRLIERAAPGTATVLIRGESGTGKELVARAIVEKSPRRDKPFVQVQCSALPETLLESELFGYERGAFTGATARKLGRVEVADGGTLFLDEIGDITLATQVKLLRLLQERQFERLGGTEAITADVRFIAATHRDLEEMVRKGEFREDLFYRLNVVPLWLPPLRARQGDVELLAQSFCKRFAELHGRPGAALSRGALDVLCAERWPGNVRQLQNFVERLIVLSDNDTLSAEEVRAELRPDQPFPTNAGGTGGRYAPHRGHHALANRSPEGRDEAGGAQGVDSSAQVHPRQPHLGGSHPERQPGDSVQQADGARARLEPRPTMAVDLVQDVLIGGRYRLERCLGTGGMGAVWQAKHEVTGRRHALKFVTSRGAAPPELAKRFLREARAASTVDHPNVVHVADVFELDDGTPVMVMDLLEGETLAQCLSRERKLPLAEVADLMLPVISAVGTAHAYSVVHRDLKPDNIFLARTNGGRPRVFVLDFGIAKLTGDGVEADGTLTQAGTLLGTPRYMSPEQSFGERDIDHRTDVWSIGVILYEALSGSRPVEGENIAQVVKRLLNDGITPIDALLDLPEDISALIGKLLIRAYRPEQRPTATCARNLRGVPCVGHAATPRWPRRHDELGPPASRPLDERRGRIAWRRDERDGPAAYCPPAEPDSAE